MTFFAGAEEDDAFKLPVSRQIRHFILHNWRVKNIENNLAGRMALLLQLQKGMCLHVIVSMWLTRSEKNLQTAEDMETTSMQVLASVRY